MAGKPSSGWDWDKALSLGGTLLAFYGQYEAGEAAYEAAQYNKYLEQFSTEQQLRLHRERVRRTLGAQRAAAAASGVRSGTGSPLLARLETIEQAAVDEYYIRRGGELRAAAREYEGRSYRRAARTDALDTLLGGIGALLNFF